MENTTQDSPDTLPALAEAAKAHRLSPADEEKAIALLCEQLKGGRAGITAAVEWLLAFPWIVSVNAVSSVWSGLSQPMQRHLISSLAKEETEQARRLRLSIARAVFKLDPAAGARLAIATAADLKNPETGALSTRNRQLFFHVFIGKGKPWLCLLPLEGAKGADALVQAAVEAMPLSPPLSQLSILRWIYNGGRFKRLTEEHLALVAKSVGRWNYRLQQALKADIPDLPEVIASAFKPERTEQKGQKEEKPEAASGETKDEAAEGAGSPESTEPAAPDASDASDVPKAADDRAEPQAAGEESPEPEAGVAPAEKAAPSSQSREERQAARRRERDARREEQREQREQRRREREPEKAAENARPARKAFDPKTFDLRDTLRGVESYVASLRQELEQTKQQLRRKDDESISSRRARRGREEVATPVDVEELTRHNARLEATIVELRQQFEDLAAHHEAVAESRELHGDAPLPEGSADQLRALLNIKLHESYETYLAMKEDPLDRVFRLDYRDLLGSVFDVLQKEGVSLKKP